MTDWEPTGSDVTHEQVVSLFSWSSRQKKSSITDMKIMKTCIHYIQLGTGVSCEQGSKFTWLFYTREGTSQNLISAWIKETEVRCK